MSFYRITVNGKSYEVEVEEVAALSDSAQVAAPVQSQRSTEAAPAQAEAKDNNGQDASPASLPSSAPPQAAAGSTAVLAPMPGTILDVKVEQGQSIAANTVLCVLEAMKMENDIIFPKAGTVVQVAVSKGKTVNAGDLLFSVQE